MSQINVSNLTFAYDGSYDNIFENVSFSIDTSWKLGFTGRNGRGKTTFLNLLLGKHEYIGKISASVDFEYFPFEIQNTAQTPFEIIKNQNANIEEWQILREVSMLGVAEDALYRAFNTLSGGEQIKIMLAALFLKDNAFLLIDEPTNHLDLAARRAVAKYLKSKSGFILVSHDRDFLDQCVDHILAINRTNIEVQSGNFSSWYHNKFMRDNFELAENEKLERDISRLQSAARRTASWSDCAEGTKLGTRNSGLRPDRGYIGHKAAKMMKRSKTIEKHREDAIVQKSALLKNIETTAELELRPLDFTGDALLSLHGVSIIYGNKTACKGVSFELKQGDRIALSGKNGSGKSSILKLACGEKISFTGNFCTAPNLKISYISQDTSFLCGTLEAFCETSKISMSLFKSILRKLDFSREQFEKSIENFSEGQKKKILLAQSLCQSAHLYIWDEPLNFIDVISRIQIENLISQFKPTMLFTEHDSAFSAEIATQTIVL